MSFSGLVRSTSALYGRNLGSLFVLFLPLGAAFFIALAPLLVFSGSEIKVATNPSLTTSLAVALLTVLPIEVGGIAVAIASLLITDRLVGQATTAADAFRKVRPHLGALFAAGLASSLLSIVLRVVVAPFAFFVHPLLYGPAILVQVIALEGADLKTGLTRAGELLRGDKLRVFMNLFAFALAASLLDLLLPGFANLGLSALANDITALILSTLSQIIVTAAVLPVVAVAMLVSYFDLRARKEDLDLTELTAERDAES
ncbi:MAG TPA: hypothetical protein VHV50_06770 [Actinomycetota bacterium]|nr:hypothetical protein [Actinomycetota bacterium]